MIDIHKISDWYVLLRKSGRSRHFTHLKFAVLLFDGWDGISWKWNGCPNLKEI